MSENKELTQEELRKAIIFCGGVLVLFLLASFFYFIAQERTPVSTNTNYSQGQIDLIKQIKDQQVQILSINSDIEVIKGRIDSIEKKIK